MFILTQGKSEIVNIDSTEAIFWEPETACFNAGWNIFARGVSGKSMTLGRYKNKARAQEVLREIMEEYRIPGERTYKMPEA